MPSIIMVGGQKVVLPDGARNIRVSNGRVWVNGEEVLPAEPPRPPVPPHLREHVTADPPPVPPQWPPERVIVKLVVEGDAVEVCSDADVAVSGEVKGSVRAEGNVDCKQVGGDVRAGGVVNCGDVKGDVKAGGVVNCGDIQGGVRAGGMVVRR